MLQNRIRNRLQKQVLALIRNRSRNSSPEPTPEQVQKQDLILFLKVIHQEIKLEMIVWLRIYLFHDHGSTKFIPIDQILSKINSGVLNLKIIVLSMFSFLLLRLKILMKLLFIQIGSLQYKRSFISFRGTRCVTLYHV
uniref:Uncharacterized protein n=1 Tax=Opuntia streptacantha TaxID=393608 RepID=A0A7C9CSN3_OPUST